MKHGWLGACCLLVTSSLSWAETAQDLMVRNYEATRVSASSFSATIELKSPSGHVRTRQTENMTLLDGEDNARVTRFLAPADVKGTATLLIEHQAKDDDMWIYLPALKKTRRLVASNKRDSFVGTDFTFGDMLGHKVTDWSHEIIGTDRIAGEVCTQVASTPISDKVKADTGYSKRLSCISPTTGIALKTDFWDEYGKPLKWVQASSILEVENDRHWQPMLLEALNLQSGHGTRISLTDFRVEQNPRKEVFKPHRLERDF